MSALDCIHFHTAEKMSEVADESVQCTIISPPYVGHHTEDEKLVERVLLERIFVECRRITKKDGVVVSVNTDLKDSGLLYLRHMAVVGAATKTGLLLKDEKIWVRSFKPDMYRKKFSFVFVFSKGRTVFQNPLPEYDIDNWVFTKSQKIAGFRDAIAPEIPLLLIRRFTKPGQLVVSACAGSGTAVIAALRENRKAVGYETDSGMKKVIIEREKRFAEYYSTGST